MYMKLNIAFVCLTRGYTDRSYYNTIISRNNSIKYYIERFQSENIIFHEGNISKEDQEFIINQSCKTKFVNLLEVETKAFRDISNRHKSSPYIYETSLSQHFSLGYRHMCHFWLIDFLDLVKDFDYIIRVDEDCIVQSFPLYVFNSHFAFITPCFNGLDDDLVIVGLQKTLDTFHEIHQTKEKYALNKCEKNPYTNFFIMNVNYFKKNNIFKKYIDYIDISNGIYINRWGDLPLMGYFLLNFVDEKDYVLNNDIVYFHGSHFKQVNNIKKIHIL